MPLTLLASHPQAVAEVTPLTPKEEAAFQLWAAANNVPNEDGNFGNYDMRGYWKAIASRGGNETAVMKDGLHYTDTYKQHGHSTFSVESQYSRGLQDGGQWLGDGDAAALIGPPVASHAMDLLRRR